MAAPKQKGFLRLSGGSLGETSFFKSEDGYTAREKKVENPNRRKTQPQFERTRENSEEFGTGSSSASLIWYSAYELIRPRTDSAMMRKLRSFISKMIKLDSVSRPGKRKPLPETIKLVAGFEMNSSSSLRSVFNSRFSTSANRESGEVVINIPSFIPATTIKAPKGATHFKMVAAAAIIDFENNETKRKEFKSEKIELNEVATGDMRISVALPANSTQPIFLFFGIECIQNLQGKDLPVANRKSDALCIVDVFM